MQAPAFVQFCVIYGAPILGAQTECASRCLMAAVTKAERVFEQLRAARGDPALRERIAARLS